MESIVVDETKVYADWNNKLNKNLFKIIKILIINCL